MQMGIIHPEQMTPICKQMKTGKARSLACVKKEHKLIFSGG